MAEDVVTGFLDKARGKSFGRPVGLAVDKFGGRFVVPGASHCQAGVGPVAQVECDRALPAVDPEVVRRGLAPGRRR